MESVKTAVNAYKTAQVDAAVLGAGPHEIIAKLLAKAIDSTVQAKKYMAKGDIDNKSAHIKIVTAIISDGLRSSLNIEAGGDIAANLDALYDYLLRQLIKAHAENNVKILDEVVGLLSPIKEAWDAISEQVKGAQTQAQVQATVE